MYARVLRKWSQHERYIITNNNNNNHNNSNSRNYDKVVTTTNESLKVPILVKENLTATSLIKIQSSPRRLQYKNNTKQMSLMWLIIILIMLLLFVCTPINMAAAAAATIATTTTTTAAINGSATLKQRIMQPANVASTSLEKNNFIQKIVTATIENAGQIAEESYIIPVIIDDKDNANSNSNNNTNNNNNSNLAVNSNSNIYLNRLINTLSSPINSNNNNNSSSSSSSSSSNSNNNIKLSTNIRNLNSTKSSINFNNNNNNRNNSNNAVNSANNLAYSYYRRRKLSTTATTKNDDAAAAAVTTHAIFAHRQMQSQLESSSSSANSSFQFNKNINYNNATTIAATVDFVKKQQKVPKVENSQKPNLLLINSYKHINNNNNQKRTIYEKLLPELNGSNINDQHNDYNISNIINKTKESQNYGSLKMRRHTLQQYQQHQQQQSPIDIQISTKRTTESESSISNINDVAITTTAAPFRYLIESFEVPSSLPYNSEQQQQQQHHLNEQRRRMLLLHQQQQAARNRRDSRTFGTMQQRFQSTIIHDDNNNDDADADADDDDVDDFKNVGDNGNQQKQQQQQQQQTTSFSGSINSDNNNNNNNNHNSNNYRAHYYNTPILQQQQQQQFQRLQQMSNIENFNSNNNNNNNNNNNFQQPPLQTNNYQNHYFQLNKHQQQQRNQQQQQPQHHAHYSHQYLLQQHQNQNQQQQLNQQQQQQLYHHQHHNHHHRDHQQKQQQQHQHAIETETDLQQQQTSSSSLSSTTSIRRSSSHHYRRYPKHQRKHGRRYCSARDPAQLAFEAPTVFEGKIVSMTSDRRANFSATVQVKDIFKQQIGYTLQKYVRLRFAYRNNSGECDIYREQLRPRGFVHGDELEQGRVYLIFVRQIDLGNFTILGQPIRKTKRVVEAVKEAVSENYAQFASIRSITASNRTVENGKELRIICKVQGRPPPKVTWFKDHKSINRNRKLYQFVHYKKRSELIIRSFNSSDAGRYECRAKNKVNRNLERRTIVIKAYPVPRYDTQSTGGTGNNCPDDASEFCFNGGTCKFFSEIGSFSCICPEGFIGERCDRKEVNSMPPSTYSNEQECGEKKFLGSYYC